MNLRSKLSPVSLLIGALCLTAVCCNSPPPETTKELLHLNLARDPASFDPRLVQTVGDLTLMRQLYEGLYRITNDGPQLALAQQVTISDDRLIYTFTLREAYWSNQDPITAHDFVRSWSEALNPTFPCDYAYMLFPIKNAKLARSGKCSLDAVGILATDDRTLVVQLERPTPYFLELTAFPTLFPVNDRNTASSSLICSGPFTLQSWRSGDHIVLEKNHSYWDHSAVHLDGIELTLIDDCQTENYLFEKGKLDWLGQPISNNIPPELLTAWRKEGLAKSYDIDGTFWFKMNVEAPPFHNRDIRFAFAIALNRQALITHLLGGAQKPATSPIPPSLALSRTPFFPDGNPTLARNYFEKGLLTEGWTHETFPQVTLLYPPTERNNKIAQLVAEQWEQALGITVQLQTIENSLYRARTRTGNYQIGAGQWIADYHDPIAFLELFKDKNVDGVGMNDTNWHHDDYAALIEVSNLEKDPEIRFALLKQAEQLLMEEMPIIPLYHYAFDYVKKEEVSGVFLSPLGTTDFKSATIR